MSQYIIYGTNQCIFCTKSKILLEDEDIEYDYNDLDTIYPNWRDVFTDKKITDLIGNYRQIPIIFKVSNNENTFLGGFEELQKDLVGLDNDY
jgi:glutaredoxin